MNRLTDRIANLSPERRTLLALRLQAKEAASARGGAAEPIAVVGIGCRLPGGIGSPEAYWAALCGGLDAVAEIPPSRWDIERYYDPAPATPGKMNTRWGGFLEEIDKFDAHFFGISPREAVSMDPQQRLLLEVSWEALEHAGLATDKLAGSPTGIFVGICRNDYGQLHGVVEDPTRIDAYFGTGNASSFAAGRISYLLGLHGPSLAIDTACSSSLVAVHLACQSLLARECQTALAGGVNLILSPTVNIYLSQLRTFAPDGRCKAFDNKADGYVRGEGCGIVVLRRLSDALADGDDVLAVIRGTAVNQDGRSAGLTAPSGPAQEAVIRQALLNAAVDPSDVDFVEAHGTGTSLGDPIELRALGAVLGQGRDSARPLVVSSVKTNLGHLEAAAGVAGLIKLVLAARHGQIPKHLHFDEPSSYIPWHELPILIPTQQLPWGFANKRRIGSVSSFGFSGTNAHVVLEEAPPLHDAHTSAAAAHEASSYVLPLSARDPEALRQLARSWRDLLAAPTPDQTTPDEPGGGRAPRLRDLCYSAAVRRAHHRPHRLSAAAASAPALAALLDSFLAAEPAPGLFTGARTAAPRVVFVYPGQGGQWAGMGRELLARSGVFRAALERCDELLRGHTRAWRLLDAFTGDVAEGGAVGGVEWEADWCFELTQCALFALQVALTRLWRACGVEPCAVIGHSLGEVAAAAAAGVLTLEEAVRVVYERSRLLGACRRGGAMAAVELGGAQAAQVAARAQAEGWGVLAVAAVNGRRASVLSGEAAAVGRAVAELTREGVLAREVRTGGVAGHSPLVGGVSAELGRVLGGVRGRAGSVALISGSAGREVRGEEVDGRYWGEAAAGVVRFGEGMRAAAVRSGAGGVYVEMGAHGSLGPWVREAAEEESGGGGGVVVVAGQRRGEDGWGVTSEGLGAVWASGVEVEWGAVYGDEVGGGGGGGWRYERVPGYAWQRQRYWIEEAETETRASRQRSRRPAGRYAEHPLLGEKLSSPLLKELVFESWLSTSSSPEFFNDHRVYEAAVVPATTYVELAMAAASEAFGQSVRSLEEFVIQEAMILPEAEGRAVQVAVGGEDEGAASVQIFSRADTGEDVWSLHASGNIVFDQSGGVGARREHATLESLRARFGKELSREIFDARARAAGVSYGPSFQGIEQVWGERNEALGFIRLAEGAEEEKYLFHPALLDMCFQVVEAARTSEENDDDCYLPLSLDGFRRFARPGREVWSYAHVHPGPGRETFAADIVVFNAEGEVIAEVEGLRFKRANKETLLRGGRERLEDWLYELRWEPSPLGANGSVPGGNGFGADTARAESVVAAAREGEGRWLIFTDGGTLGSGLAEQLKARGGSPVLVSAGASYRAEHGRFTINPTTPEHYTRLISENLNHGVPGIRGVVYLWGAGRATEEGAEEMLRLIEPGCGGVLRLLQAVVNAGGARTPRLWIVTRGAQQLAADSLPSAVAQSVLWGLGRTIVLEHPELKVGLVDMSEAASDDEVALLLGEMFRPGEGDQVSFRGRERRVARLARAKRADVPTTQISLSAEATYLITGGLGGIGLKLARWMVERGARHLVLLGRSGASEAARVVLDELEAEGAQVSVVRADVADRGQLAAALEEVSARMPPLRGVVHAALVLDDGVLLKQDWENFRKVLAPKAAGAWNLHLLTRETPLDFFVMFSSVLSLIGGSGQGNYTAASAFVDALAHYRRAAGLPALSINWGPWAYEGSAAAEVIDQHSQLYDGFTGIAPQHGLDALGRLLRAEWAQLGVMPFDWRQWGELYPAVGATLLSGLIADEEISRGPSRRAKGQAKLTREALLKGDAAEREKMLRDYLHGVVARRLGVSPSAFGVDDSFPGLGLDSLMTLEIRNRIVDDLGVTVSPVKFLENPSIAQLTAALHERWVETHAPAEAGARQEELLAQVALLSDEEVEASLRDILASTGQP